MAARRIGDVYELPMKDGKRFFLRHVDTDRSQLSSSVVQVFDAVETAETKNYDFLHSTSAAFYVHVFLPAGEAMGLWKKVGRVPVLVNMNFSWCTCPMAEIKLPRASKWTFWETNKEPITVRSGDTRLSSANVGVVFAPQHVVELAHTGKWTIVYPQVV